MDIIKDPTTELSTAKSKITSEIPLPDTATRNWAVILQRLMPLLDFLLIILAFRLGYTLRYDVQFLRPVGETYQAPFESYWTHVFTYAAWIILTPPVVGAYRQVRGRSWIEEAYIIAQGVTTGTVMIMALNFLIQPLVFSRLMILEITVLTIIFLSWLRLFYRTIQSALRRRGVGTERVLLVGFGEVGRAVAGGIIARKDLGYQIIGYLDDDPERADSALGRIKGLGEISTLKQVLDIPAIKIDLVIITLPWRAHEKILEIVAECEHHRIQSRVVPDLFRLNLSQVRVETLGGIPLVGFNSEPRITNLEWLIKRILDITLVLLASPVLLIPSLIIAALIKLDSPGPIFFRHPRVGRNGREFKMLKFRSMYTDAEARRQALIDESGIDSRHFKMKDDPRITRVGKWIRRLSIDEWPNFLNVLKGDMSLVGPRAPTPDEVKQYEPWQRQRLNTLPGVSGLWQVSGRSDVPFEEMCLLDIHYIENWSLMLDIQIILRTIPHVLFAKGAY
jgi:exopolysaccharide biosynthesis polyprenyl glycosylphosphotransferase